MRKSSLLLLLLASATGAAQAQKAHFGIKAGAALTSQTGNNRDDNKNILSFYGGVAANFAVNKLVSIQPEVLYSMKGTQTETHPSFNGAAYTYQSSSRLHYLDVPVLARISGGNFFFEAGPQVGFLLAARQITKITGNYGPGSYDEDDLKNSLKSLDFGYVIGLGYQLPNGLGAGLRYNGGFTDTNKNPSSAAVRNRAFQLYLSVMISGK